MAQISTKPIEEEMKHSYMDYAMSVIVGRSLPDVRDGLKPVQRRILYSMYEMNLTHDKPFKKSARIVGEVMGKYHPHGEAAIYDALVRMAQPFTLRYILVDGQGNFGSIDGDSPAAMRYTEARLKRLSEELLEDIDKDTVPMMQNFDGSLMEPVVLPSKFPNLLVNGSSGIAVGMATNMPPHNMGEVIDATIYYIKNRDCSIEDLMKFIKGPDFPTGGSVLNYSGLLEAYKTGRGTIKIRAKYTIEEGEKGEEIIFTEIPYEVNKSELLRKISELVKDEKITGIQNLKDESDKSGIRIVIKLKKDANSEIVLNQLFEHTQLEVSYGIINLALIDNIPKTFNLKDLISEFVKHRFNVIRKRVSFILKKDEEREHILQGYLIILDHLDEAISTIRSSKDYNEAKNSLMQKFSLSEIQAKAILDLRLQRLTAMERQSIINEEKELRNEIERLKDILSHENKVYDIMVEELEEIKKRYSDERRTEIIQEDVTRRDVEDLIPPIDVLVTLTKDGYIKRIPLDEYRSQGRGGSGVVTEYGEGDFPKQILIANNRDYLLLFSNKGRVYWLKCYKIVQTSRKAIGKSIRNYLNLENDEHIQKILPVKDFNDNYVVFLTEKGIVKKTPLKNFSNPMARGIIAITLKDDSIVDVALVDDNHDLMIATSNGQVVKFPAKDLRPLGRKGYGVRGVKLRDGDLPLSLTVVGDDDLVLTVTEKGKGKITKSSEFRRTHRGTIGIRGQRISETTGKLVAALKVENDDVIMIQTQQGMTIQFNVNQIPEHGRNATGVKLMELKENDSVIAITRIPSIK